MRPANQLYRLAMLDSSAIAHDPAALSARFAADGYLLLRSLLDADLVEAARSAVAHELDWPTAPSHPRRLPRPDASVDRALYGRLFAHEELHLLGHDASLVALVRVLLGTSEILLHPNPAIRVVPPSEPDAGEVTTAHQDAVNMQGSEHAVTAWMPLVACGLEMGPIELAVGSHRGGARRARFGSPGRVLACSMDEDDQVVAAALFPGDVVVFDALTVHRTRANRSEAVRCSVDVRYQRRSDPICEVSLRPPPDLDWSKVSQCWSQRERLLAWQRAQLEVVAFEPPARN